MIYNRIISVIFTSKYLKGGSTKVNNIHLNTLIQIQKISSFTNQSVSSLSLANVAV
jgi:hypothetical protein